MHLLQESATPSEVEDLQLAYPIAGAEAHQLRFVSPSVRSRIFSIARNDIHT